MVYGFFLMPLSRQRSQRRSETRALETMAADLCALVYRQGKTDGRFEMPIAHLLNGSSWTREEAIVTALSTAESRDWIHRSRGCVALKAAGIFVAKGVLGLSR
jgi:hypothetical protein